MPNLFTLILQIAVILSASRLLGSLFRKIHQPRVLGEMFAGILLGPSLLGWMAPQFSAYLFPTASMGNLNALSQLGLIIFMFLVGLGINPQRLKHEGHAAILISHVSITVPFVLACALALYLYPKLSDETVSFAHFALFLGAAMSITAFPVLARILSERNMLQDRLGTMAIACAAVDDVTGWCILAYIVTWVRTGHSSLSLAVTGIVAFALTMIYGVRYLLRRLELIYKERRALSDNLLAVILLLVLVSALCTEWLGVHLLFGAFLLGAVMPKDQPFVLYVTERFETITVSLLLPIFFAFTGLRTSFGLLRGKEMWICCGLIVTVAVIGKLGGTVAAARMGDLSLREAVGLGALMNTRGLMELVILNIGLDIHIISPALFSMMVIMALVTTFMTAPLLEWICPSNKVVAESKATQPVWTPLTELTLKTPDRSIV